MMKKVLTISGTRPEAIKIAPVILELQKHHEKIKTVTCSTGQHRELLKGTFDLFGIDIDYNLDLMVKNQTLTQITAKMFVALSKVFEKEKPDWVLAQGDTTTVMVASIISYYNKVRFGHIEAGLRTGNLYSPYPEEGNRLIADTVSYMLWAPTQKSANNLLDQKTPKERILVTGNTVIDALRLSSEIPFNDENTVISKYKNKKVILITAHRRESFGDELKNIFLAIKELSALYKAITFVFPMHFNPNVRISAKSILENISNVDLIEPLDYLEFINLMKNCFLILTDSGGIQEEAPYFNVPVLVMRKFTERQEGVEAGTSILVGTEKTRIINVTSSIIEDNDKYNKMAKAINPYGDGWASKRIVESIIEDSKNGRTLS
jgi:UDP-N-acetylglucosamine 2-epimerase (non-hydrolysing)